MEVDDTYVLLDSLIENEKKNQSIERFPYWAEIWPSSIGLAKWLHENISHVSTPKGWVKELGCGVGLVGISLAAMGWHVEATDYVYDALILATENARINKVKNRHRVSYLDWKNPVGEFSDCIVASDIIYEKKNHKYLGRLLDSQLARGGNLFISDPQRVASKEFVRLLKQTGYRHQLESIELKHGLLNHAIDIHHFVKP